MMCICGNTLPANAEECPACGGSFNSSPTPIPKPRPRSIATPAAAGAAEAKPRFDPVVVMSILTFVAAVLIGVAIQSLV